MRALLAACGLVFCIGVARAQSGEQTAEQPADATPSFGAVARIRAKPQAEHTLDAHENAALRRSLGDSFNPVEALPGTVPVFSGVPYLLVRGAPPAGTAQYYDDVPVPALFHLALGPEITHSSLIGGLIFHPGVAPARYGRRTGAVLVARPPSTPSFGRPIAGELEARLLDAHALVRAREPAIAVHGRLGYPNLLLNAIDSNAVLSYWDYFARIDHAIDARDQVTLLVFGAGDRVGDRLEPDDDIALQFHRALARLTRVLPKLAVSGQVYAGYEQGVLGPDLRAEMLRVGPSTWLELQPGGSTRVRVGLDMEAKLARVRHEKNDEDVATGGPNAEPGSPDGFLPDAVDEEASLTSGPEDIVDRAPLTGRAERNAAGAYAELALSPADPIEVELGVRSDGWVIADRSERALDPRALVRVRPLSWLGLHAGAGTAHQAAVSPIPIPGLSDLELDYGLQRAIQTEAGAELQLPGSFALSATGFFHRFSRLVFLELIVDCEGNSDPVAPLLFGPGLGRRVPLCEQQGLPRGDGQAYGAELLLRRSLLERFSGWISYTLAWGEATAGDGTEFVPQYDVRHVLNAVLTQDWGAGFSSGLRLHYRSGKPAVNTVFDFSEFTFDRLHTRLPPFFRADVTFAYEWPVSFGKLALSLQFLNATFSREATKRDCSLSTNLRVVCEIDYQPAIVLPNVGLRAEL
ncbi:MAG TPA: TonB-dependent receptor [Polyangiales bacterium]|nr:TonB-dependent receptor [Polyangiales bacterium]